MLLVYISPFSWGVAFPANPSLKSLPRANGKAVQASRDIIGNYERNDNSPSIEMAVKLAKVFDVPLDFLLGEGQHAAYDKETIKRLQDIENLDNDTKNMLFQVIDTFLRDSKARVAYS